MAATWKKLGTRIIHKNKWVEILEDDVIQPNGTQSVYTYISRKSGMSIALIDGDEVYMVEQYRYPSHQRCLQFVLETAEENENLEDLAKRGVREELGLEIEKVTIMGKVLNDAGLNLQQLSFAVAEGVKGKVERKIEPTELDIVIKKVKIADLDKLVDNDTIKDMHTVAGIYYLKRYLAK